MVRVGFCLIRKNPHLGEACLNLSDDDEATQDLRIHLSQGADLPPTRKHPITEAMEQLVVGLEARGDQGYYRSFLYTTSFREAVPEFLVRDEATTPIFILVERLRLSYGGMKLNGPWPEQLASEMGSVNITNMPNQLETDCNIGLSDITYLSNFSLEDKVYIINEFEKLSKFVKPEDKVLRWSMLHKAEDEAVTDDSNSGLFVATSNVNELSEATTKLPDSKSQTEKKDTTEIKKPHFEESSQSETYPKPIKHDGFYKCPVCNYQSKINSNTNKHIKTHYKKKMYICNICGKSMSDLSNYKVHCQRHEERYFCACNICGKRFSARNNLIAHKKIHTQDQPKHIYEGPCIIPHCKHYRKHFKNLMEHIKIVHSLNTLEEYKLEILNQHKDLQSGDEPCSCPDHQIWITKFVGDRHSCYLCECSFVWSRNSSLHDDVQVWERTCRYALRSRHKRHIIEHFNGE